MRGRFVSGKFYLEKFDKTRGVLCLSLNRPEVRNAFNDEMIEELTSLFLSLNKRDEVRLVLLEGKGKAFCAGADLNWMKKMKDYSQEENKKDSEKLADLFKTINKLNKPVIGLVKGYTLGGGAGLISVCDYVLASDQSQFGFTEARLGLVPAVISPYVISKIGESQARAYFLSGQLFSAEKALQMGLVHQIVSDEYFSESLEKLIGEFLKAAPLAAKEAKGLIQNVSDLIQKGDEAQITDYTCETIARIRIADEGQEGMTSLLEKKSPSWINKV